MDRKAWIAVTLSVLGLFGWQWYVGKYHTPPRPAPGAVSASPTPGSSVAPAATPQLAAVPSPTPSGPVMEPQTESISQEAVEFVFNNDAGGIERAVLRTHKGENEPYVSLNRDHTFPVGAIGFQPGEVIGGFDLRADRAKDEVFFSKATSDGLQITKRFAVPPAKDKEKLYTLTLEVAFANPGTTDLTVPNFFISTGGSSPIHATDMPIYTRFDWSHDGSMTVVDVNWFGASSIPLIGISLHGERPLYSETKPAVDWAAVTSQYFCTVITPKDTKGTAVWARRFETRKHNNTSVFGMQGALGMQGFTVPAGTSVTRTFEIYSGPKELSRLRKLGPNQDHAMNFGWFGFVSEFLLWAMNSLHSILGSYAASIIVLTLLIKSALWPIQNKATNEMRKMAALGPKMTELREKLKDDPQKMNEEVMKLYKEYGVNPLSGCFPMLIQIPIFFGFYSMLGTAIELRNSSFFWIQDLSQPDTVGHLLGFPINLLPIVMAGTMVWQMAITPKSGDAMQQRIFYFMPIIFLVFCYNYASGLALYWTTQNIFSIVQLYLTRNTPLPTLEKKSVVAKREAAVTKKKKQKRNIP